MSCLGGFVWALQVWMWERIPVGRNFSLAPEEPWKYPFDGDEERYPTITHTWANVQWTSIAAMGRYKAYISELDMLTYEQVNWRPYTVLRQYPLSNMCLRDQHLWRVRCPMICFYAVEWHLPHRVSKQFGVQHRTPPDYVETSVKLHKTNRQSNKTVINWEEHRITWVDMWNAQRQHRVENDETPDTDEAAYLRHLEWMRTEYRVIHKAAWTRSDCLDLLRVRLLMLHSTIQLGRQLERILTMVLSMTECRAHEEEIEEEDESDNEAADPDFIEFGASQMDDAPQPSQPTQPTEETCRASSRNIRRPGWQNTQEGYVTKGKMAAKRGRK
ncbi:hypothetical protein D1007_35304 [Hordeum vulgare]|nr:hypothetical protein D1007_35304 [Hordeum vulgare]